MYNIWGLVCPWIFMRARMEEVDIGMDKQEHSTVVLVMLYEALNRVKVACPLGGRPMRFCVFDGFELLSFALGFVCDSCMV